MSNEQEKNKPTREPSIDGVAPMVCCATCNDTATVDSYTKEGKVITRPCPDCTITAVD